MENTSLYSERVNAQYPQFQGIHNHLGTFTFAALLRVTSEHQYESNLQHRARCQNVREIFARHYLCSR